jgi:uncharacterized protein (DUF2062 family)
MKLNRQSIASALMLALKQGSSPQKLAATCALGAVMGIFPVFGTTTLLCMGLAVLFRLNIPVIQLVNYMVTALQVLLIIPFIKTGIFLFGLKSFTHSEEQFMDLFKNDFRKLLAESGLSIAAGVVVWCMVAIPLFFLIYYPCLLFFARRMQTQQNTSNT